MTTKSTKRTKRQLEELTENEKFCRLLKNNKVKDSKEFWGKLTDEVQEMFLDYSTEILNNPSSVSEDSYKTAYYLCKLFRNKEFRSDPKYSKFLKNTNNSFAKAKDYFSKPKLTFENKFQKKLGTDGPLKIYYETLLAENPESKIALIWLVENGFITDESLLKKYQKIKNKK